MIMKLRRRFVLISVAVLSVAMLLLAGIIDAANWASVRRDIAETAEALASSASVSQNEHGSKHDQHIGRGESQYESRYFVVTQTAKGSLTYNMTHVASYTEDDAESLFEQAKAASSDTGLIGDCYYTRYAAGSRVTVLFLDCSSKLSAVRQVIWISVFACLGGILIASLVMILFSKRAVRPILENTEKQKRFITDASHELKTPLSVIGANMDLMAMDDPDNEWIRSTRRQVGLMDRMVRDLVFLTRSDEETRRPEHSGFDLARLLRDTADPFVMMAEAGGRGFTVEAPEQLPVLGDPKGIERLISVLCDNAVKYSPDGDQIVLRLTKKGVWAAVETENVPAEPVGEEQLAHLFDRFYRADGSRTKKDGRAGFGIGLAIALAVAQAHEGDARAFMKDGKLHIVCRLRICKG